ncbi:MAG: T9SS type A sorting domain-containing protein [Crocinitomicaceae bacterium]|nr:T9SS type A sorting domain-containing protein [Crocinitomicaceae bacterium]
MKTLLFKSIRTSLFFIVLFYSGFMKAKAQTGYAEPASRFVVFNATNPQPYSIVNPDDANFLILFSSTLTLPFNPKVPSSVSGNYVTQNAMVIQKDSGTGQFELSYYPSAHEYYHIAFAEQTPNGDFYLSRCGAIGIIKTDFDASLLPAHLDSLTMRECKYQPDCGMDGYNRYEFYYYNSVIDSIKQTLQQELNNSNFLTVPSVKMTYLWENEDFTYWAQNPNTSYLYQVVCERLLDRAPNDPVNYNGCRTYQLKVDLTVKGNLTLPENDTKYGQGTISEHFSKKVLCKDISEPVMQIHQYLDSVSVIQVPCENDLVGAEYWLSEYGNDLIQGPPPIPPGVTGLPHSNYWKCSYTVMDPNAGVLQYEGINKKERFTLSSAAWQAANRPHLVWVNYLDRFGKRSARVPIVLINMKHEDYSIGYKRLSKDANSGHHFDYTNDSLALLQLNQFIDSINPLISQYGHISYNTWQHQWRSKEMNLGFFPYINTPLTYDMLPDSAASKDTYTEEIRLFFHLEIFGQCGGNDNLTSSPTFGYRLREIEFEKAIYPPKPEVLFLRDESDSTNVCLTELENNESYIWEYYTSSNTKVVDNEITGACFERNWKDFYSTNANQYLDNAIRYDIRARAIWRGDTIYSEPIPILLAFDVNMDSIETINEPIYRPQTADEDELNDYCINSNPEPGTYRDLTYDESNYQADMNANISQIEMQIPSLNLESQPTKSWNNSDNYGYASYPTPRVCYGNLQPGDPVSDDRGRSYTGFINKRLQFDWNLNVYALTEDVDTIVFHDMVTYSSANGHRIGISTNIMDTTQVIYLYKDTTAGIPNPNSNLCLNTNPSPPTNIQGCQSFENNQVCVGDTVAIGTQNPVGALNPQSYTYDWYDNSLFTDVISDTTLREPNWQYHPGMSANSQFWYYLDTYDPVTMLTYRHCASVTICPNCSSQVVTNNQLMKISLELFPNPASNELSFVLKTDSDETLPFEYQILDVMGRVMLTGVGQMDQTQTEVIMNLENGNYYLVIREFGTKKFTVNR